MFNRSPIPSATKISHLLWHIPDSFGGMTRVALRRASLIADATGRPAQILTLAPELDAASKQRELRDTGFISRGVEIRNLWCELRAASARDLARIGGQRPVADNRDADRPPAETADGTPLHIVRRRADGTIYATDRRDVHREGTPGGRRITLYDTSGAPVRQWSAASDLYLAWIRHATRGRKPIVLSDSNFVGGFMGERLASGQRRRPLGRRRPVMLQVLHSNHRQEPRPAPDPTPKTGFDLAYPAPEPDEAPQVNADGLHDKHRKILINADAWDRIVVLTDAQLTDLVAEQLLIDNVIAVPNSVQATEAEPGTLRPHNRGIMAQRFTAIKRIDHAIQAVCGVDQRLHVRFDVYGDGPEREHLEDTRDKLDAHNRVALRGFAPSAHELYHQASFTVLTSLQEGQSLALLESMAAGCIPIAYNIRYGPADLIEDGVTGFLVEPGNIAQLTATIERFLRMDDTAVAAMRAAARARAEAFSPANTLRRWARVLGETGGSKPLTARKAKRGEQARAVAMTAGPADAAGRGDAAGSADAAGGAAAAAAPAGSLQLAVELAGVPAPRIRWVRCTAISRAKDFYERFPVTPASDASDRYTVDIPLDRIADLAGPVDFFLDARIGTERARLRIAAGDAPLPLRAGSGRIEAYATKHGNLSVRPAAHTG